MGLSNPYTGYSISFVSKPLPIFTTIPRDAEGLNSLLLPLIDKYRKENEESHSSNVRCNWRSNWEIHKLPEFQFFNEWILQHIQDVCSYHLSIPSISFKIMNEWIMQYEEGDYAVPHEHFPHTLSIIYYADCDDNAAPVIFENDLSIQPEVGKLIIFPSNISHQVKQTKGRRTVVSLNVNGQ